MLEVLESRNNSTFKISKSFLENATDLTFC